MKSAIAIIGAFAALANANVFGAGHHLHFPRNNATVTPTRTSGDAQTTLTVIATKVQTIISCAPTVTNCPVGDKGMSTIPASDRRTSVVTNTVVLTKTVCPVSEAEKISSSVISDHNGGKITGSTITAPGPVSTAAPGGGSTPTPAISYTTTTINVVTQKTVTLTMGSGDKQSVVPTVIKVTVQSTVTVPCSTTQEPEPTTTTTATRTRTRTLTISQIKEKPTGPVSPGKSGEACNDSPTVTVTVAQTTVTAPASTVFVTVPCDATKVQSVQQPAVSVKAVVPDSNNNNNNNNGGDKKPNTDGDKKPGKGKTDVDCPPDVTTTLEKVVTVVPYPIGNGTATATSGAAGPSGMARIRR